MESSSSVTAADSIDELLKYPERIALKLVDEGSPTALPLCATDAISWVMGRGIDLYTRYSGVGTPEIALHGLVQSLRKVFVSRGLPIDKWQEVRFLEAWDLKSTAQSLLAGASGARRPRHVFGDMMTMLRPKINELIEGLAKSDGSGRRGWEDIKALMLEYEASMFTNSCPCICHGGSNCNFSVGSDHHADANRRLRLCVAGLTCKDWSPANKFRKGLGGPSGRVLLTWIMDVRRMKFDIIITECVEHQDMEPIHELLGALYEVHTF